jgi:hypothetical protein
VQHHPTERDTESGLDLAGAPIVMEGRRDRRLQFVVRRSHVKRRTR